MSSFPFYGRTWEGCDGEMTVEEFTVQQVKWVGFGEDGYWKPIQKYQTLIDAPSCATMAEELLDLLNNGEIRFRPTKYAEKALDNMAKAAMYHDEFINSDGLEKFKNKLQEVALKKITA